MDSIPYLWALTWGWGHPGPGGDPFDRGVHAGGRELHLHPGPLGPHRRRRPPPRPRHPVVIRQLTATDTTTTTGGWGVFDWGPSAERSFPKQGVRDPSKVVVPELAVIFCNLLVAHFFGSEVHIIFLGFPVYIPFFTQACTSVAIGATYLQTTRPMIPNFKSPRKSAITVDFE